jgi:hypothetical protein
MLYDSYDYEDMTTNTNLRELVTRSAAGHAIEPSGTVIPLDSAARLYAAAARDLDEGNFGSAADDAGRLPVELETADEDTATLNVHGLRYVVELEIGGGADTVTALCEVRGCPNLALGQTRLARVCEDHLGEVTTAAQASGVPADELRERRLSAWEQEITDDMDRLAHRDLHRLKRIREGR